MLKATGSFPVAANLQTEKETHPRTTNSAAMLIKLEKDGRIMCLDHDSMHQNHIDSLRDPTPRNQSRTTEPQPENITYSPKRQSPNAKH